MNLHEHFKIDPDSHSGVTRLSDGKHVGYLSEYGYWRFNHNGKQLLAHRVIYCLFHDFKLDDVPLVDHFNRDRMDNSISNLRELTKAQNNNNRAPCKGVSFCKQTGKWKAGYKGQWLGRWDSEDEATQEVNRARAA